MRAETSAREERNWWAVADDDVKLVRGYSCAPANPQVWWCPDIGYSLTEAHHLFNTQAQAIDKLISELNKKIETAKDNIESLKLRKKLNEPGRIDWGTVEGTQQW